MNHILCLLGFHKNKFYRFWKGVYRPHFRCKHCVVNAIMPSTNSLNGITKTQTMPLTQKLFDKIEKASVNFGIENQTASPYIAYRRGATEWTEKAQGLVDTLDWIKRYGPCDEGTLIFIDKALAKYKEVENDKTR